MRKWSKITNVLISNKTIIIFRNGIAGVSSNIYPKKNEWVDKLLPFLKFHNYYTDFSVYYVKEIKNETTSE